MATLIGYAVPLSTPMPGLNKLADHTYVRTADGRGVWGCWGRSDGGHEVCRGTGSSRKADCLSQPWGTSGIIYGLTGVCHQTANRILYPAGALVSKANAYWLSSLVYGTYGRDPVVWGAQLLRCAWTGGDKAIKASVKSAPETSAKGIKAEPPSKEDMAYTKQIIALYKPVIDSPRDFSTRKGDVAKLLNKELDIAIEIKLKGRLPTAKREGTLKIQREIHADTDKLVDSLYAESITPAVFAKKANDLFNRHFKSIAKEIGQDNYHKLLGASPEHYVVLVNPDVMTKPHRNIDM